MMMSRLTDFERAFDRFDEFRRHLDRVWEDLDGRAGYRGPVPTGVPHINVFDSGAALTIVADVPGLTEKDLSITFDDGVVTVAGERKSETPEGYSALRRERTASRFSRSLKLPARLDPEKASATVKDGVLTLTIEKVADVKPRQIAVRAGR